MKQNIKKTEIIQSVMGAPCNQSMSEILTNCNFEIMQLYHNLPESMQESAYNFLNGKDIFPINSNSFFRYLFMENTDYSVMADFIAAILGVESLTVKGTWDSIPYVKERADIIYADLFIETNNKQYADVEIIKTKNSLNKKQIDCLEADMMLRQYNRVKKIKRNFKFDHLRTMHLIIISDSSEVTGTSNKQSFSRHKTSAYSTGESIRDTVNVHLISLDAFKNAKGRNKTNLDGWLTLLTSSDISEIYKLINVSPVYGSFYNRFINLRNNPEKLIQCFHRQYMDYEKDRNESIRKNILTEIDTWHRKIDEMQKTMNKKDLEINELRHQLEMDR